VILFGDPGDYQTWEDREDAKRVEPDPERLNAFVSTQLSVSCHCLSVQVDQVELVDLERKIGATHEEDFLPPIS
jgi:hypothetical protein